MGSDNTPAAVTEAGRVLSAANANALVAAWRSLGAVLQRALGSTPDAEDAPAAPASEAATVASDLVPLLERAVRDDGTVPLRIIAPGWGSSGYYSADVLERDGPRVFTSGLHMYLDHPSESESLDRPERSVRDLAGRLVSDARWDPDGAAGPGLYAEAEVFGPFRDVLDQIAPHIGVSIRAAGMVSEGEAEGRQGRLVDSLVQAESVDWVTRAGAGGQVVGLLESARAARSAAPPETVAAPVESPEGDDMELTEATARIAELEAQLAVEQLARAQAEATGIVAERLAATDLPAFATRRITDDVLDHIPMVDEAALDEAALIAAIDAAVQEWRADLAGMTEAGVQGVGPIGAKSPAADTETELRALFGRLGLSESGREIAIRGR